MNFKEIARQVHFHIEDDGSISHMTMPITNKLEQFAQAVIAEFVKEQNPVAWGNIGKQGWGLWHEKTDYYSVPLFTLEMNP